MSECLLFTLKITKLIFEDIPIIFYKKYKIFSK